MEKNHISTFIITVVVAIAAVFAMAIILSISIFGIKINPRNARKAQLFCEHAPELYTLIDEESQKCLPAS